MRIVRHDLPLLSYGDSIAELYRYPEDFVRLRNRASTGNVIFKYMDLWLNSSHMYVDCYKRGRAIEAERLKVKKKKGSNYGLKG